jgi:hypothetical protein
MHRRSGVCARPDGGYLGVTLISSARDRGWTMRLMRSTLRGAPAPAGPCGRIAPPAWAACPPGT